MIRYMANWRETTRNKYCSDICSHRYVMTRIPQSIWADDTDDMARWEEENRKNTEYAIKHQKRRYNKRRKEEDKIVFI